MAKAKAKKSRSKNWIASAIGKPGALHKALGINPKEKIGPTRLAAAAKRKGKIGQEARLAITLGKMRKGRK